MKKGNKWFRVTITATITKTQDIQAESEEAAEQEAEELFNPYSGEAEEKYTQEIVNTERIKRKAA